MIIESDKVEMDLGLVKEMRRRGSGGGRRRGSGGDERRDGDRTVEITALERDPRHAIFKFGEDEIKTQERNEGFSEGFRYVSKGMIQRIYNKIWYL